MVSSPAAKLARNRRREHRQLQCCWYEVSEAFGASFIGGKSIDFFGDIPVEREGADTIFEVPVEVDR